MWGVGARSRVLLEEGVLSIHQAGTPLPASITEAQVPIPQPCCSSCKEVGPVGTTAA